MKTNVKYSYKKLWYIASLIRGLSIDSAINQMKLLDRKGAKYILETLKEAKDLAIQEHNVEFGTNLWVCEYYFIMKYSFANISALKQLSLLLGKV